MDLRDSSAYGGLSPSVVRLGRTLSRRAAYSVAEAAAAATRPSQSTGPSVAPSTRFWPLIPHPRPLVTSPARLPGHPLHRLLQQRELALEIVVGLENLLRPVGMNPEQSEEPEQPQHGQEGEERLL